MTEAPDLILHDLRTQFTAQSAESVESSVNARLHLAQVLNLLKKFDEALSVLSPVVLKFGGEFLDVVDSYVQALIGSGQDQVAFSWIQQLAAVSPAIDPLIMLPLLVRWAIKAERPDLAEIYLDNLRCLPAAEVIYIQLAADLHLAEGEKDLAIACLESGVEKFPQSRWLKLLLVDAYSFALKDEQARQLLHQASAQFGCEGKIRTGLIELATKEPALSEAFHLLAKEPEISRDALFFHRRGVLFFYKGDLLNAEHDFKKALEFGSGASVETVHMLSEVMRINGDYDSSLNLLKFHYLQSPQDASLAFALAYDYLAARDWVHGWPLYEQRLRLSQTIFPMGLFPTWDGSDLSGQSVLVLAEQGLGDVLMAASQLERLDQAAASWIMVGFPQLEKLFTHTFGSSRYVTQLGDEQINSFQTCIGICSLHHAFNSAPQAPLSQPELPFLSVDPADVERWRSYLNEHYPGRRCFGFTWFGGGNALNKQRRSLSLDQLLPLFQLDPEIVWISMQYGGQSVEDELQKFAAEHQLFLPSLGHLCFDLYEQAALLLALDHTISVQQTLVHLAGSVGATLWTLLPTAPEWRYGNTGSTIPWYPSVSLYRQSLPFQWSDLIDQVAIDIKHL